MRTVALALLPTLLAAQTTLAPDRETALIRAVSDDFRRRVTIVENDAARDYLNALAASFRPLLPDIVAALTVSLMRPNLHKPGRAPVALPDGQIMVPIHSITAATDEADFARHFTHALSHIALRHGFPSSDRTTTNSGAIPLVFFGGLICNDERYLFPIALRPKKEKDEAEADAYAARLLETFRPNPAFAALQAELGALAPPPAPPTLRRTGEVRQ